MLITIDTGGTKTLIASFNNRGVCTSQEKFPTPKDSDEYLELIETNIAQLAGNKPLDAISVAVPGVVKKGVVEWCTHLPWQNFAVQKKLQARFGVPVFVENDANLAGLAETKALPQRYDNSLYVTISTGIGMGLIIDHAIHPALTITEPEDMILEYDGKLRSWGSIASGRSIKQTYGKFARDISDKKIWDQIADKISRGFLVLVPTLNPDIIIIGGSIGTHFDKYELQLEQILREKLHPMIAVPPIRRAVHPEEAVIYGCYYYAVQALDA